MSGNQEIPKRKSRVATIASWLFAAFIGVSIAYFVWIKTRLDPRTISDMEGRYMPGFSLKELARAMHDYHAKNKRLPPHASYSDKGIPLLSWRVLILPYVEQSDLFHEFKLDEPWDSPHNLALLPKMPAIYAPLPGRPPMPPYTTPFKLFVGKGTAFEGREGLRLKDFPRLSFTILIVEAYDSVPWTKPEDIDFDENRPLPKLGRFFDGYSHAVMADATSCRIVQERQELKIRAAALRNNDLQKALSEE